MRHDASGEEKAILLGSFTVSRKRCQVTFEDLDGIRHSVTVEAESLYEAAALALQRLKRAGFIEQPPGPASALHVDVLEPTVTHRITVGQLRRWLDLGSSNPMEEAKRKRLRELLA
jgi:hypothetical protein